MIEPHGKRQPRIVPKGWGREEWFHNSLDYCGKVLVFHPGKKCSLHFHVEKKETFYVAQGAVRLVTIDRSGTYLQHVLQVGDAFEVPRGLVHQIGNPGEIDAWVIEASTFHQDSDSYRIERGD